MNNLIFFILLEMLNETQQPDDLLHALVKREFRKKFNRKPTIANLHKLGGYLHATGYYDNLPWDAEKNINENPHDELPDTYPF